MPRFSRLQKFSSPFVWTSPSTYCYRVIDYLMLETRSRPSYDCSASVYSAVPALHACGLRLEALSFSIRYYGRADLALAVLAALQDSHDCGLVFSASAGDRRARFAACMLRALPPMKVSSAST